MLSIIVKKYYINFGKIITNLLNKNICLTDGFFKNKYNKRKKNNEKQNVSATLNVVAFVKKKIKKILNKNKNSFPDFVW